MGRCVALILLFMLFLSCTLAARGELRKYEKKAERRLARQVKNDGLGATTPTTEPLHRTWCGDHVCRPGEGNLKGYKHWSMPWEPPPITGLTKAAPHGWTSGAPFPEAHYRPLISLAQKLVSAGGGSKLVVFAAADFDFRELGENWYRAAQRAGIPNALIYALDAEACGHFLGKGIPTANGTDNLNAWAATRLQRHIQRALAERHMAAAALASAGFDVLLSDTTHVFRKPIAPFFERAPPEIDVFAMRGGCSVKREPQLGCGFLWNFLFLRGSAGVESKIRRERLLTFVQSAVDVGMVDFYLRWWAGHHCIFMGYTKMLKGAQPTLVGSEGGLTPALNVARANMTTSVVELRNKRFCRGGDGTCLRIGHLPFDRFPPPGLYRAYRSSALVGRTPKPDNDPARSHRLRLDRYDEIDFSNLKQAMVEDGLWVMDAGVR